MPIIDLHAHVTPERFKEAIRRDGHWYGLDSDVGELFNPGFCRNLDERLRDMNETGIDMQLVTPTGGFYQYGNELETTVAVARECNDEIIEMVTERPERFAGLGTVPMQDPNAAVAELERVMSNGLKGAMINDHVNGMLYFEPEFLPFFKAAEELGALLFIHQAGNTVVTFRTKRYKLGNAIGNLADRTLTFASLVYGGVMDRCPDLKVLLAHGGGYATFGIARIDKVSGALEGTDASEGLESPFGAARMESDYTLTRAPSTYVSQFYYDCCTYDERALRYIIDTVGIDRVVLGTDYPAPMLLKDAVNWINGLESLTADEKSAILADNATALLGL